MADLGGPPADLRSSSYDYDLPPERVAQNPSERRDGSRLLILDSAGRIAHTTFGHVVEHLRPGDLLVANDTRVIRARFRPRRREGGKAEVLLVHPVDGEGLWEAMARPGKRVRKGDRLALDDGSGIEIVDWAPGGNRIVRFYGTTAEDAMSRYGEVPLPPYIRTPPPDAAVRYQTVYGTHDGSVAAPTAGLHFTPELIERVRAAGFGWETLTLDVGPGTFRPVKSADIRDHVMHSERYEISDRLASAVAQTRSRGGRIVAVGTTSLRALEASAQHNQGRVTAEGRWTSLFVYPPFEFRVVDALITNFHLPRSSLLMLVCAFAGRERVLAAYREAVAGDYRFYSFGDAMLVERARA
jgi:S-adenosylmethionine:tRNA ribosyltransferase-isomerase